MIPNVTINGISLFALGWLRENIDFPIPQSQTNTIVVPGRNSPIRYTEALGAVSYEPRSFTIVLSMLGSREKYNEMLSILAGHFAGQLSQVILSEEPELYCVGTLQMENAYDPLTGKGQVTLSCEDGDAYRYYVNKTVIKKTGSGTVTLTNDAMPVVPEIKTTAETSLSWAVGGDTFRKTLNAGTWEIPELELAAGNNSITISSTGTTTFTYQEGRL